MESVNVVGTRNVVEACLNSEVRRFIHFSSIHALVQEPMGTQVNELRPLIDSTDCTPYEYSKAIAEREVRKGIELGLDAVILNPTGVIGPHDYQLSYLSEFLLALAQGKLPALVDGGFNWVDVRDIVSGSLRAEKAAPTGAKYLLSGHWASTRDIANLTEEILGVSPPRLTVPSWVAHTGSPLVATVNQLARRLPFYTPAAIRVFSSCNLNISHDRATRELGYLPRPLRETLTDTFHWFQESGHLDRKLKPQKRQNAFQNLRGKIYRKEG